ncbi:MAG: cache domain-containing protein [Syntrophorhabdaceae bacterium]
MKKIIFVLAIISFCVFPLSSMTAPPSPAHLDDVAQKIQSGFETIDKDMSRAAEIIGRYISHVPSKRKALRELCTGRSYAVDCVFINAQGIMELIEPAKYRKHEGTDLKNQDLVRQVQTTRKPVFGQLFAAAEGIQGIVFEYPVFDRKKNFAGSVSLLVMPEVFVADILNDTKMPAGTGITIVEPDGKNVYSTEPEQIRLSVLTSPQYKGFNELHDMVRRIIKEKEGTGSYRYTKPGTEIVVKKDALWKTVTLWDSFWRVVVTSEAHAK